MSVKKTSRKFRSAMIRSPLEDAERARDLLEQDHAGHLVGEGHGGEREALLGEGQDGGVESFRPSQEKRDLATCFESLSEPRGEALGGHRPSRLVEGDQQS